MEARGAKRNLYESDAGARRSRGVPMTPRSMIAYNPIAAVVSDPQQEDNPIIECNAACVALTGYAREEIIGRNCRFLAGPKTEPWLTQAIRSGVANRRPVLVEILNYKKDGTPFRNAVMVAPIFDEAGRAKYFLGSQIEITGKGEGTGYARHRASFEKVEGLSPRQREVLIQMAAGRLNKQIAHTLGIAIRTVKMHRAAVLETLDVRSNAEAIRIAVEAGY